MDFEPRLLLLGAIVLFAFTTEAAIGFGSTIITLVLGVRLYPIHQLLPMIVSLNLVLQTYMVARHRDHIAVDLVRRRILPWMGIGAALGFVVFQYASSSSLKRLFGIFVLAIAVREVARLGKANGASAGPLPPARQAAGLLAAGVVHGMFATGGPLLVWVLGRANLSKRSFRSTLAVVWWLFNVALIVGFVASKQLDLTAVPELAMLVPAVLLSIAAGEHIHGALDERRFRLAVSFLLIVAGLSIVV